MKLGTKIRIAALLLGGTAFFEACATKQTSGTDSSTHWMDICKTDADCGDLSCDCGVCTKPCTEVADCGGLPSKAVCQAQQGCTDGTPYCLRASSTPSEGGLCPDGAAGNEPCDGRIAQCWTPCVQGFHGQLVCDRGTWLAGHGLFPCGADGGAAGGATGTGGRGAGGAGRAGAGGASSGGSAGVGGIGTSGAGGASDAGSGGADSGLFSDACETSQDCTLIPTVCCPICRPAMLSERRGINVDSASAYQQAKCATAGACPPCVPSNGSIDSVCKGGKCGVQDFAPYTACTKDEDCKMVPKDCCACGTVRTPGWIGVSDVAGFSERCGTIDCPNCPDGAPSHLTQDYAQCFSGFCWVISGA